MMTAPRMERYGNMTTRISRISVRITSIKKQCILHWHDYYELEVILSGSGTHYLNGATIGVGPGSCHLLTPADMHRLEADTPMRFLNMGIPIDNVPDAVLSVLKNHSVAIASQLPQEVFAQIVSLYDMFIADDCVPGEVSACYLSGVARIVLGTVLRYGHADSSISASGRSMQGIHKALYYIRQNCREAMHLKNVADHAGLSPSYFSACFKKAVGCGFRAYLSRCRVTEARNMLIETDMSVTEIAFSCGFGSQCQFYRAFSYHYGKTPLQLRRDVFEDARPTSSGEKAYDVLDPQCAGSCIKGPSRKRKRVR